jgi:hypothetical protein
MWNLRYTMELFRRVKAALRDVTLPDGRHVSIGVGISVVDPVDHFDLGTTPISGDLLTYNPATINLDRISHPTDGAGSPLPVNLASARSVMAVMEALAANGILDDAVYVRYASWTHRPRESSAEVDDHVPGSQPHTMNALIEAYLLSRAL